MTRASFDVCRTGQSPPLVVTVALGTLCTLQKAVLCWVNHVFFRHAIGLAEGRVVL
jgi:hypothetical protein